MKGWVRDGCVGGGREEDLDDAAESEEGFDVQKAEAVDEGDGVGRRCGGHDRGW